MKIAGCSQILATGPQSSFCFAFIIDKFGTTILPIVVWLVDSIASSSTTTTTVIIIVLCNLGRPIRVLLLLLLPLLLAS